MMQSISYFWRSRILAMNWKNSIEEYEKKKKVMMGTMQSLE